MDANGFRKTPSEFVKPDQFTVFYASKPEVERAVYGIPADDARYPAFAAPMADARTFTDYRSHCDTFAQPKYHNQVREWMQKNALDIRYLAVRRQAENTGAVLGTENTMPPFETVQACDEFGCSMQETGNPGAVGLYNAATKGDVTYFGTFEFQPEPAVLRANRKDVQVTTKFEGGRNTINRWSAFPARYSTYS